MKSETNNSNDLYYSVYSAQQIVDAYVLQSKAVWNAVDMLR